MVIRVDVITNKPSDDPRGGEVLSQSQALGVIGLTDVRVADVFHLRCDALNADQVSDLVGTLLTDPVVQNARWRDESEVDEPVPAQGRVVEVAPQPGVTDSVAESLVHAAHALGFTGLTHAATGHRYTLTGDLDDVAVKRLAIGLLANEVIHRWAIDEVLPPAFAEDTEPVIAVDHIPIRGVDDELLLLISKERRLSLDLIEMRAIRAHFETAGREPTDVELEMLAQTWSEHCVHKTFQARVELDDNGVHSVVDNMYRSYIKAATKASGKTWLKSVFTDNAGIIAFDDHYDVAFKAETHNHPSALEPFGGANTGVGGVVRDVIGVSARPIATTDVLCFGPPDLPFDSLPEGVLHPRRIAAGVIAGVGDYGNKMGIPTVNGAIVYDRGYTANPLVYVGCVGILPIGSHPTSPQVGDLVISMGGRTGRDGLRGATFSSMEMSVETSEVAGTSVQIGHPIHEKTVLDVIMVARDEKLYNAITDCGAGGLSSAVGEMGSELGARVQLERVPLKYQGLHPWEVWLSEAQERMVLSVPADNWPRLLEICEAHDVEAVALGTYDGSGRMHIQYNDLVVADLDCHFLHDGIPQRQLKAVWRSPQTAVPALAVPDDLTADLKRILAMPDVRSKEDVVRTYDHEVQGGTVVKPFVGINQQGPSDASVLWPLEAIERSKGASRKGLTLSVGINPQYGKLDPYAMAWAAVDEAIRNAVAVGADPDQIAILDNFCWGNPNLPDRMGGLVKCAEGCHDASVAYGAPFISGKDSLNNEYTGADGDKHAIPGTLLISALGIVPDISATTTMDLKSAGNALYLLGKTRDELGGSSYLRSHGFLGQTAPAPVPEALDRYRKVHRAIAAGLVRACHDCSDGGVLTAVAEMAFAGGFGANLDLSAVPTEGEIAVDRVAFSETSGRLVMEVPPYQKSAFEAELGDLVTHVGVVTDSGHVVATWGGREVCRASIEDLKQAWRGHIG